MENILLNRTRLISALDNLSKESCGYCESVLYDVIENKIIIPIKENRLNDYLIVEDDEMVSFCKGLKSLRNRSKLSIGRYIRRNLGVDSNDLGDYELDDLVKTIKLNLLSLEQIEKNIVFYTGDDIVDFYKNCDKDIHSCMTGKDSYKTKLYALNPNKVCLAVYDNKSRGLLWTLDKPKKVLDRVYPDDQSFNSTLLKHWAKLKGYYNYEDMDTDKHFYVSLKHDNIFPYLDTFFFGKKSKNIIKLCNNRFYKQNAVLDSSSGQLTTIATCMFCKKTNNNNDFRYCGTNSINMYNFVCQSCYDKYTITCNFCNNNSIQNNIYKKGNKKICLYCLKKNAKPCTNCGKKLIKNYIKINVNGFDCCLCDDCSMNYYACSKCNSVRDEEKSPKTIKRNRFYCSEC